VPNPRALLYGRKPAGILTGTGSTAEGGTRKVARSSTSSHLTTACFTSDGTEPISSIPSIPPGGTYD
jgi:hypothetical protein